MEQFSHFNQKSDFGGVKVEVIGPIQTTHLWIQKVQNYEIHKTTREFYF